MIEHIKPAQPAEEPLISGELRKRFEGLLRPGQRIVGFNKGLTTVEQRNHNLSETGTSETVDIANMFPELTLQTLTAIIEDHQRDRNFDFVVNTRATPEQIVVFDLPNLANKQAVVRYSITGEVLNIDKGTSDTVNEQAYRQFGIMDDGTISEPYAGTLLNDIVGTQVMSQE